MIFINAGNTKGEPEARRSPCAWTRFDLNLRVVQDALPDERNVTRAGNRLHIGQSAASAALGRLRDHFGDELLVPVGRQPVLTPLAQSLVAPVRDTLLRARATIARKPGFDPPTAERRFAVCASDDVTSVMLADAVRRMAGLAPGAALDIRSPPKDEVAVVVWPRYRAHDPAHAWLRQCLRGGAAGLDA